MSQEQQIDVEAIFCQDLASLKGMYRVIKRSRFVFINESLSGRMQRIICAHEPGYLYRHILSLNLLRKF